MAFLGMAMNLLFLLRNSRLTVSVAFKAIFAQVRIEQDRIAAIKTGFAEIFFRIFNFGGF